MQTETHAHQFATVADAKLFALAGNATITLESLKTGAHFTYRVREAKPAEGSTRQLAAVNFVSLLRGPDNDSDSSYMYLGLLRGGKFTLTRNSKAGPDAPSVKAFAYFWSLGDGAFPSQLVVHHEMRCGRCNRVLTVPESITRGIGPDCAALMGLDL